MLHALIVNHFKCLHTLFGKMLCQHFSTYKRCQRTLTLSWRY